MKKKKTEAEKTKTKTKDEKDDDDLILTDNWPDLTDVVGFGPVDSEGTGPERVVGAGWLCEVRVVKTGGGVARPRDCNTTMSTIRK